MNTIRSTIALLALALSVPAFAQSADHRLGDHPAVIVKRLEAQARYDYASKFYPHPAWLYLLPEAPRLMPDQPPVLASGRQNGQATAASAASLTTRVNEFASTP